MLLENNPHNNTQALDDQNLPKVLEKFYKNFQYYIILITIITINKNSIKCYVDMQNDIIILLNGRTINLDILIQNVNNKAILSLLIHQDLSIFNIKFDLNTQSISIMSKKITLDQDSEKNLSSNLKNFYNLLGYFLRKSMIDYISSNNIINPRGKVDNVIRIGYDYSEQLNEFQKRQVLKTKRYFYQSILEKLIVIVDQLEPLKEKINLNFQFSPKLFELHNQIWQIKFNYLEIKFINRPNTEHTQNITYYNLSFQNEISNIFNNFFLNTSRALNPQQRASFSILQEKINNIINNDLANININNNYIQDTSTKFRKIIDDFKDYIINIQYSYDFNNRIFEQNDPISIDIRNQIKQTIDKIRQSSFNPYLRNLFNDEKFFGDKIQEITYHSIYNKYKNSNLYQSLNQFADNLIKIAYIQYAIETFFQENKINSKYAFKHIMLHDLSVLNVKVHNNPDLIS